MTLLDAKAAAQAAKSDVEDPAFTTRELQLLWEAHQRSFITVGAKRKPKPPPEPKAAESEGADANKTSTEREGEVPDRRGEGMCVMQSTMGTSEQLLHAQQCSCFDGLTFYQLSIAL